MEPGLADAAIAAFSIVSKIMMFAFSALLGFGQGFQPICGYNYGARKYDRVRKAYTFCLYFGAVFLFIMSALGFLFAGNIVALFRNDPHVIQIGTIAMRCQCSTFTLMALVTCTNMLYQNIGRVVGATLLAVTRQGLMFISCHTDSARICFTTSIWGRIPCPAHRGPVCFRNGGPACHTHVSGTKTARRGKLPPNR